MRIDDIDGTSARARGAAPLDFLKRMKQDSGR